MLNDDHKIIKHHSIVLLNLICFLHDSSLCWRYVNVRIFTEHGGADGNEHNNGINGFKNPGYWMLVQPAIINQLLSNWFSFDLLVIYKLWYLHNNFFFPESMYPTSGITMSLVLWGYMPHISFNHKFRHLTRSGLVMHICVSKLTDNGVSPDQHLAII